MKKSLPLIIAVVLILGVGAWWFLGRGGGSVTLPGEIKKEAGEEGESFTGKMKDIVTKGIPVKCTYSQGDFSGTNFIKGEKVYGEVAHQGKTSYLIIVDNCMWNWEGDQGVKMCFEEDIWESEEEEVTGVVPVEAEYRCSPAIISDSQFTPPADISFMDMADIEQMMQMGQ